MPIENFKISIIIPVLNAQAFLSRSIESALGQSYQNIELILVDDGSTDHSQSLCSKYAAGDSRIKLISQQNKGPAAARNSGLRQAKGDFVFFLDADDFIQKKTIEILVDQQKQCQSELIMSNFNKQITTGQVRTQKISFSPNDQPFKGQHQVLSKPEVVSYLRHFLKHPSNHLISYCWGRLYKLSIIKENSIFAPEGMRLFEDFIFNLKYLNYSKKPVLVNQPLYNYCMNNNRISASMAIINADSLLHDMKAFKSGAADFLQNRASQTISQVEIDREIGHALIHYLIIFMVRSC